jgi:hypothetical protein
MNIIPLTCSCSVGCFVQSRQPNNDDILFCLLCIESHPRLSQEKFIPCFQCPTNPDLCFLRKRPFSFSSQITAAKKKSVHIELSASALPTPGPHTSPARRLSWRQRRRRRPLPSSTTHSSSYLPSGDPTLPSASSSS